MRSRFAQLSRSKAVLATLVGVIVAAVAGTTVGYAALSKDVTLTLDGETRQVSAIGDTVADVLAAEGIEVTDKDLVAPSVDETVTDGSAIAVQFGRPLELSVDGETTTYWVNSTKVASALGEIGRRFEGADLSASRGSSIGRRGMTLEVVTPKVVQIKLGGKDLRKRTLTALTVADVLESMDFEVDEHDKVTPSLDTEIADGDKVVVTDIRIATKRVRREAIDAPVVEREDPSMYEGEEEVVQPGRDGVRAVTYRLRFVNGELAARKVVRADVRVKAVPTIVRVGTKEEPSADFAGGNTVWDRLAQCESGGNWAINTGNGYYGGLQFSAATWASVGGTGLPHQHSREEQIKRGQILQARAGWGQWPSCSAKLGLR
ncbi:resuscitation-promoting factor RpfB [Nocardioides flavus (ex Wang et al. 2016)]|uniref:Resuscitation-promoting factor RpfB n=1 Tax=Nocardioides flavus (ex Wang et al. 2016) TaxID=2058780 RepID=A0ABQ3HRI4_9ACTN|nr:resuscitation-promoting factor [Nocardioides flavus (ex Wang et al. 2016)]GHE19252.1 resuscitation-promoting factor RpfB [Nocardioides flavus (ex Wang et al. 2016)]